MKGDLGNEVALRLFGKDIYMNKQINQLRADLMAQFPERKDVIDGSLAAILAGEHVLLIGPPGTAKSALVRAIAQAFGGSYFERLLTKFSTPEEIFGPISLKALEQDRFARVTAGKLPEAEFAFVDEIFKSNSAVLDVAKSDYQTYADKAPMAFHADSARFYVHEIPRYEQARHHRIVLGTALLGAGVLAGC